MHSIPTDERPFPTFGQNGAFQPYSAVQGTSAYMVLGNSVSAPRVCDAFANASCIFCASISAPF